MQNLVADEKRRRARRARLLAIPKGKRTAAEERQLDSMAVDYILQATGAFGADQKLLAETGDRTLNSLADRHDSALRSIPFLKEKSDTRAR